MTPNEYLQLHNILGQYIKWKICQHYNATYAKNWHKHKIMKKNETKQKLRYFTDQNGPKGDHI